MRKFITFTVVGLSVVATAIVLFSLLGAAVFFLPLLGGAFAK